ncbi:MAG: DUF1684 domain-containing protein [Acidobacteriota bacterium]
MSLLLSLSLLLSFSSNPYLEHIREMRSQKDQQFANPATSPLATITVFRLRDGAYVVGSASDADWQLGLTGVRSHHARILASPDEIVLEGLEGEIRSVPPDWTPLRQSPDGRLEMVAGKPVPRVEWQVGERYQIGSVLLALQMHPVGPVVRIIFPSSPEVRNFSGLKYFPVDPRFRLQAWIQPRPLRGVSIVDTQGWTRPGYVYGKLLFQLEGQPQQLDLILFEKEPDPQSQFMLIYRDATSGKTTYSAGRYLYLPYQEEGKVWLDFNLGSNPYCAYGGGFACPLPLPGNRLTAAVRAGEKKYHESGQ